ncbi:HEAT repeat domain-containing protein [Streptomyces humi]|uniref:HEAT repeat domain-containing protein n=1 Tax=Streptomyces humi TaxID=1428620 RepID=UPI0011609B94|nr:HEAT repeat domain-containing protein [Streptomyces humi]
MNLPLVFVGLDQVDWAQFHHAYGSAEDVPALLRDLASPVEETAAEAEQELWSSIVHQGTVYTATAPAVPFLARLVVEGVRRSALVGMLGVIAQSVDEHDLPVPGAARGAVAAQLGLLLPLLADDDREVRRTTAWTLAQCRSAAGPDARAALRARWAAESDPIVRADVLTACALLDPDAAEELCSAVLAGNEPAPVQVAALLAIADCDLPWNTDATARVTTLVPLERHGFGALWEREPLQALTKALQARGEADTAIDVVRSALGRAVTLRLQGSEHAQAAITEARWAAESLARRSRTAPARLLPELLPLLDDPATVADVIPLLRTWCQPASEAVPALLALAQGDGESADEALAALVCLGAPEATRLLARHLPERPRALEAAYRLATGETRTPGHTHTPSEDRTPLPYDPELLAAIRVRLAAEPSHERRSVFDGGLAATNEPVYLSGLLAAWGRPARAGLPELLAALPRHPLPVSRALAIVADPQADAHVIEALRAQAGQGPLATRQAAASALHSLTGDADVLISVLSGLLAKRGNGLDHTVTAAAALKEAARPLLPLLHTLLAEPAQSRETVPVIRAALGAAALVWELTRDEQAVLPVIKEGLAWASQAWGQATVKCAAEVACLLGPAAEPLVPDLLPLLDDPELSPALVLVLTSVYPEADTPAGLARTALADRVLAAARPGSYARSASAVLEAFVALGPTAFTAAQLDLIRNLADGDRRIVGAGLQDRIIFDDERFRTEARKVLRTLTAGLPLSGSSHHPQS